MKIGAIRAACRLPVPISEAWDFFSDPRNLQRITPPSLSIRITSDPPPRMHPGMIVTYAISPFPAVSVRWVTEITHVVEPGLFVDEQRFGPYRFWHHQHHFREIEGGTSVEDIVHYALPFGFAGSLLGARIVRRRLDDIFSFRRRFLEETFGKLPPDHEEDAG